MSHGTVVCRSRWPLGSQPFCCSCRVAFRRRAARRDLPFRRTIRAPGCMVSGPEFPTTLRRLWASSSGPSAAIRRCGALISPKCQASAKQSPIIYGAYAHRASAKRSNTILLQPSHDDTRLHHIPREFVMAAKDRTSVLLAMMDQGVIPVFYHHDVDVCKKVIQACANGGAKCIEFTNRGDFAAHAFYEVANHFAKTDPSVIMGVGSILDAPTAGIYIANGAKFVVGPLLNADVAKVCNRRKIAYSPGCGSMSEISYAEEPVSYT